MGSQKATESTQSTQQAEMTEAEKEMQKLQLQQYQQTVGPQTQAQMAGLNLINMLLTGTEPLPGFFNQMSQGISPEAIGTQASRLAGQYGAGFQSMGIGDSGVAYRETARGIANELLYPAEQFNIGAKQNLLNLALSGQAQVQAPVQAGANTLATQLAGLRSISMTGTTKTRNPFLTGADIMGGVGTGIGAFAALSHI